MKIPINYDSVIYNYDLSISTDEDAPLRVADIPYIIDPGNSANNLYYTGFGNKTMEATKNEWDIFAKKIDTLDLSVSFEKRGLK